MLLISRRVTVSFVSILGALFSTVMLQCINFCAGQLGFRMRVTCTHAAVEICRSRVTATCRQRKGVTCRTLLKATCGQSIETMHRRRPQDIACTKLCYLGLCCFILRNFCQDTTMVLWWGYHTIFTGRLINYNHVHTWFTGTHNHAWITHDSRVKYDTFTQYIADHFLS